MFFYRSAYLILNKRKKLGNNNFDKLACDLFQTFCGTPKRTILLDVIKYVQLEEDVEEDLAEYLEIHFQKSCNNGGEIDIVKHISGANTLQAFFCEEREEMNDDL